MNAALFKLYRNFYLLYPQMTENTEQTDVEGVNIENAIDTKKEPFWAMGTSMNGKLFQNLNLTVEEIDDEAYVSTY